MTQRILQLPGQTLVWRLKRSARRSIGLKIGRDGLTVTLPNRLPIIEAERAIHQKLDWILQKLDEQTVDMPGFSDGSHLFWLGDVVTLRANSVRNRLDGGILHLAAPDEHERLVLALTRFCQRSARSYFTERVAIWGERMGLRPNKLALSSARGRWGSCSAAGGLRLNWRLMQAPPPVIDYVVIHELAHLAELNHSPRFWAIVDTYCPSWRQQRDWLKRHSNQLMSW